MMPFSISVADPVVLESEMVDDFYGHRIALIAADADGNRVTIVASHARWNEALRPRYGPRPSAAETARAMYLRGEIDLEAFERALDNPSDEE